MSGLLNFIKGLFASIVGIFSKKAKEATPSLPTAGKRSKGYFLEMDGSQAAPAPKATAAPKPEAAEKPKSSPRQEKLAAAANATSAKTPVAAPPAKPTPVAANTALNLPQPTVTTTFAPDYLTPKATASRRRPGANMTSFLNMARQVKTAN